MWNAGSHFGIKSAVNPARAKHNENSTVHQLL